MAMQQNTEAVQNCHRRLGRWRLRRRRPAAPLALAADLAAVLDVHVHRALSGENGAASAAALVRRAPSRSEKSADVAFVRLTL